jgi:hypothetical protein
MKILQIIETAEATGAWVDVDQEEFNSVPGPQRRVVYTIDDGALLFLHAIKATLALDGHGRLCERLIAVLREVEQPQ